jgi:hypothetical protein
MCPYAMWRLAAGRGECADDGGGAGGFGGGGGGEELRARACVKVYKWIRAASPLELEPLTARLTPPPPGDAGPDAEARAGAAAAWCVREAGRCTLTPPDP